jgi:hypothetical protein
VERDYHTISLHTPAFDPLHELMVTAGGTWRADGAGGTLLVKLLDPPRWIAGMYPLLLHRARAAQIGRPCHIRIRSGADVYRFSLTRRCSRLVADDEVDSDVCYEPTEFAALLLGNRSPGGCPPLAPAPGQNGNSRQILASLFPAALFWQSQFDFLRF